MQKSLKFEMCQCQTIVCYKMQIKIHEKRPFDLEILKTYVLTYSTKAFHRVAKVEEPPEDKVKSSEKNAVVENKIRHELLPLVDHIPEAALGPFNDEAVEGIFARVCPVEHEDQHLKETSTIEMAKEMDTERAGDEVKDSFVSSYYMIDKLLTELINIAIERNDCQLRRVEVLKELEKAKKLHDYLSGLQGASVPNGAVIQRQEGAYIFNRLLNL